MRNLVGILGALLITAPYSTGCAAETDGSDEPREVDSQAEALQYVFCTPNFFAAAQQHYIAQEVANGGNAASCMSDPNQPAGNENCRVFNSSNTWIRYDVMIPRPITSQLKLTYDVKVDDVRSNNGQGGWKEYGWYTGTCTCQSGNTVCVKNPYSGSPAPNGNSLPASVGITH